MAKISLTEFFLLLYVFFIPVESILFIDGLGTLSRLIGYVLLFAFVLEYKKNLSIVEIEGYIFILFLFSSILWAKERDFEQYLRIANFFLLMFLTANVMIQKPQIYKKIILSFSLSSIIVALTSFLGFLETQDRYGSLDGLGLAPLSLLFAIAFAFQLSVISANKGTLFSYLMLFGNLLGVIATGTRASWLAVSIVFTLFLFTQRKVSRVFKRLMVTASIIFFIITLFPEALLFIDSRLYSLTYDRGANRTIIWKVAWEMWKDSPIYGFGYRNFPTNFTFNYINQADISTFDYNRLTYGGTGGDKRGSHNDFVGIAVELGVLGFTLFVLWIKKIMKYVKSNPTYYFPFLTLLLMSLFQDNINQKVFWLVFGITIALKYNVIKNNEDKNKTSSIIYNI